MDTNKRKKRISSCLKSFHNSLYKYYSFDENYNEKRLFGELYFNSPDKFNDLFDAQHQVINNINEFDEDVTKRLKEIGYDYSVDTINCLKNGDEIHKLKIRKQQIENVGITCFTNSPLSNLMWAYYGENKGYCLEYDTDIIKEEIIELFREKLADKSIEVTNRIMGRYVKYKNILPSANLFVYKNNLDSLNDKYFYKAKCWKHEKEYRIVLSLGAKTVLSFKNVVKSITFGYNMSKGNILNLLSIIAHMDYDIDIYFLRKVEGKDEFEREKFVFDKKDTLKGLIQDVENKMYL